MVSIPLAGPLIETRFVERPNRFVVRCAPPAAPDAASAAVAEPRASYGSATGQSDAVPFSRDAGDVIYEAHMADPGRLRELLVPGRRVWLRPAGDAPHRRTRWSAVLVESPDGEGLVSVDTTLPNRLIHEALRAGALEEFDGWTLARREVTLGGSRIDFLLHREDGRQLALEVKSVTLVEDGVALFPDAVTERGARHVRELAALAQRDGWDAAILFVLQRPDATRILAAADIDPGFATALQAARLAGVRILGRRCTIAFDRLTLDGPVPAG